METMKAVVLCAGRGGRLYPLTKDRPKCLLQFGEKTVLECCLENLKSAGIQDVVLVTGYRKESVEALVKAKRYQGVSFVFNEQYAITNTAYSLNLALKKMDADFILVNGDVLFDRAILEGLLKHPVENCIAVDADIALDAEEIKVKAADGRVERIGKDVDPGQSLGEAIGLYKVSRDLIQALARIYDDLEKRGENHHFFEKGFEEICQQSAGDGRSFGIFMTDHRPWVEIDTVEDFLYATREVFSKLCR
jgi:choline kinase